MSDVEASMNLPEGVLIEILSWLPVRSLLRFRCVSKTWLHWLSSDPRFMELHLGRFKHKNPGIIVTRKKGLQSTQFYCIEDCTSRDDDDDDIDVLCFAIPFNSLATYLGAGLSNDFRVVSVCNGLVCLTDFYHNNDSNVYVWNPLIRDHITILVPPFPPQFCYENGDGHPDRAADIMYAFGFHQGSNEYKVLRLISISVFEGIEYMSDVSVYTLGTDSWRSLGDIMDYNILCYPDSVLVDGTLHWIAPKARPDVVFHVLVSFDLQGEFFREIPQPQYIRIDGDEDEYVRYSVGELSGLLCVFRIVPEIRTEIWMMKEYGAVDSWSKQFNVKESQIPIAVANNEEIVLLENDGGDCHVILSNPKTNSIKSLHRFGFPVYERNKYTGSLLLPTMINRGRHSYE